MEKEQKDRKKNDPVFPSPFRIYSVPFRDIEILFPENQKYSPVRKNLEEKDRPLEVYRTNLTQVLYEFYGGKIEELPYLETEEDSYVNREGIMCRKREVYPNHLIVNIQECRDIATLLIQGGEYDNAMKIMRRNDRKEISNYINSYIQNLLECSESTLEIREEKKAA